MNRNMKLIGIFICVGFLASLAAPALAFSPVDRSIRHPCIFLDNATRDNLWQNAEKASRPTITSDTTILQTRLDAANNLTKFLEDKGYGVKDLWTSLDQANSALQQNDTVAFREASRTFLQSLHTDIRDGTIDRTVLAEYFRSSAFGPTTTSQTRRPAIQVINSLTTIPRWIVHHVIPG
jgi:hypothetical protein